MNMTTPPATTSHSTFANQRWILLLGLFIGVLALLSWWRWGSLAKDSSTDLRSSTSKTTGEQSVDASKALDTNQSITVSAQRQSAMGISIGTITVAPWDEQRVVQAKLDLDPGKHYLVTAPSDLIVEELLVPLGMWVDAGEPLIRLSSSPVSLLRSNLVRQKILADRAKDSLAWHRNVSDEVTKLVARILASVESGKSLEELRTEQPTADYGAKIIAAFARYRSAERLLSQSSQFADKGILSSKSIIERESEREAAKALLQGAIEQSQFDIRQAILQAEAEQAAAQGELENQTAELRKYLGIRPGTSMNWSELEQVGLASGGASDQFVHRSPGSGVVLERYFANGERATAGENLLLVADTSSLWLVGDLRQQDWDLLSTKKGDTVQAEVLGLENEGRLEATIQMIGGRVSENSGGIQMTASISNTSLKLRPGMIARLLPRKGELSQSLPASAVFSNDGVDYVLRATLSEHTPPEPIALATGDARNKFTADGTKPAASADGSGNGSGYEAAHTQNQFEVVAIGTGRRSKDRIEVLSGLRVDDRVILNRVFELASEAFLERE
ncbi:MAG: efflux RND transporter periplasmic adaptor subunit [Planctomycetota bacterium]|nr:efflux RND transporter periplasmic adaptor subunit [Planctomycetota bacterium]